MKFRGEKIEWVRPEDYGLQTERELELSGYYDIAILLGVDDPQETLGVCTEDTERTRDLYFFVHSYFKSHEEICESILYRLNGIKIVLSHYEGGLSAVTFLERDRVKVEKQLLSLLKSEKPKKHKK